MTLTVFAPSLFASWEHDELFSVHENICGKKVYDYKWLVPKVAGRLVLFILAREPANPIEQREGKMPHDSGEGVLSTNG